MPRDGGGGGRITDEDFAKDESIRRLSQRARHRALATAENKRGVGDVERRLLLKSRVPCAASR
jgi:hypothetical protein